MLKTLIGVAIALVLVGNVPARAELWCGSGRGTPLDHPCTDQDAQPDPAVVAVAEKYSAQWMAVHGVWQVSAGTNQTGTPMEIRVYVQPPQVATARDQIPSEVENIPVSFIPKQMPTGTSRSFLALTNSDANDPTAAERQEKNRVAQAAFSEAIGEFGRHWNDLPGVIGVGPGKCKGSDCDYSAIKITVQAQFMDDVKQQIPATVDGVPVVFIPYSATDQ
jgi:hypothetical protein